MKILKTIVSLLYANPSVRKRIIFLRYLFVFWAIIISLGMWNVQITRKDFYRKRALSQRMDISRILKRGNIFTKNNWLLATTVNKPIVYIDPSYLEFSEIDPARLEYAEYDEDITELCKILKLNKSEIISKIKIAKNEKKRYLEIFRKLPDEDVEKVKKIREKYRSYWLNLKDDPIRVYPNKTFAAHVLGFVNFDKYGSAGIEQAYENQLRLLKKGWTNRDRLGRIYANDFDDGIKKNIVTTIDEKVQLTAETLLQNIVTKLNAKGASAIVMDASNGEIQALANYPTFDPNNYNQYSNELFRNQSISSPYFSPTLFKLFIKAVSNFPDDNRNNIKDCESLPEYFTAKLRRLGLTGPTGIDLPAESSGTVTLYQQNAYKKCDFSQGVDIGTTPVQITRIVAVAVNNGRSVTPHVVSKIITDDNQVISEYSFESNQVINEKSAQEIRDNFSKIETANQLKGSIFIDKTMYLYSKPEDDYKGLPGEKKPGILITGYTSNKSKNFVITLGVEEPKEIEDINPLVVKFYTKMIEAVFSENKLR